MNAKAFKAEVTSKDSSWKPKLNDGSTSNLRQVHTLLSAIRDVLRSFCVRFLCLIIALNQILLSVLLHTEERSSFIGFIGLVGKDPDIERGLLIDTGASINLLGSEWLERFKTKVLNPLQVFSKNSS